MFYVIARFCEEIGGVLVCTLNAEDIKIEEKSNDDGYDKDGKQN